MRKIFKKSFIALLSLAILVSSLGTVGFMVSAATATIVNGGFEDGINGYNTDRMDYTVQDGKVKLTPSAGSWYNSYFYQEIEVEPDTEYVWNFKVEKTNNNAIHFYAAVLTDTYSAVKSTIGSSVANVVNASEWDADTVIDDKNWAPRLHNGCCSSWNSLEDFSITFNSGSLTKVRLALALAAPSWSVYTDDWSLTEYVETEVGKVGEILNGDFKDGINGYSKTDNMGATAGDGFVTLKPNDGSWFNSYFYQEITVEPDTDYVWNFKVYEIADKAPTFYASILTDRFTAVNSTISTSGSGATVTNASAWDADTIIGSGNFTYRLHQASCTEAGYKDFSIAFNSGSLTKVRLTLALPTASYSIYTTNWSLAKVRKPGVLVNGDFKDGINGYTATDKMGATAGDGFVTLKPNDEAWFDAYFYQEIIVEPDTDYVWNFKVYEIADKNPTFYATILTDSNKAVDSTISTSGSGATVTNASAWDADTIIGSGNFTSRLHQASCTEAGYKDFTITFNSGSLTKVRLTLALPTASYSIYTTNWSVSEKSNIIAGDIDGDGDITSADLIICRQHLLGVDTSYEEFMDINEDGDIDIRDLVALKKKLSR